MGSRLTRAFEMARLRGTVARSKVCWIVFAELRLRDLLLELFVLLLNSHLV
jgi:hypothetical protein